MRHFKFQLGQTVKLKTGGPRLTIVDGYRVGVKEMYTACLFDGNKLRRQEIPGDALKDMGK